MGNIKFEVNNRVRIFTSNGDFSISEKIYKELWKNYTHIPKIPNRYLCERNMV